MEPLNLMVSLSHFGESKSTLPPKQPRRDRHSLRRAIERVVDRATVRKLELGDDREAERLVEG